MSNIVKQRLAAGQSAAQEHPHADVLTAFLEHSLKEAERQKILGHLSVCADCRNAVALALPEQVESPAVAARGFRWGFPAAVRWASVTAALAVLVGVGVLFQEHRNETSARSENTPRVVSSVSEPVSKATVAQPEQSVQQGTRANAPQQQIAQAKIRPLKRLQSNQVLTVNRDKSQMAYNLRRLGPAEGGAPKPEQSSAPGVIEARSQPAVVGAFVNSNGAQLGALSRTEAVEVEAATPPAAPAAAASSANAVDLPAARAISKERANIAPLTADFALRPTPPADEYAGPVKVGGLSALSGTPVKKSGFPVYRELVSWTITTAGKLQRQFRGAVKLIEPAPGVVVRAVAFQGIEVWAGGSQPDLRAKQWQQAPVLFHSSDAGESWTQVNGPWHGPIDRLDLTSPSIVKVVAEDGVWVSRDAGKTWVAP